MCIPLRQFSASIFFCPLRKILGLFRALGFTFWGLFELGFEAVDLEFDVFAFVLARYSRFLLCFFEWTVRGPYSRPYIAVHSFCEQANALTENKVHESEVMDARYIGEVWTVHKRKYPHQF